MTRKAILGAVVVALFLITSGLSGVGGAAMTDASETADASSAPLAQETTTTEANETENETASITFEDQQSNGSAVVLNETNLSDGGFVAIFDDGGELIGNTTYLESGVHENLTVELNVTINETQVLVAVPHLDTNGNETFDFNATRAAEIGTENATDRPYLVEGATLGSTAYVTVGNESTRRTTTEARGADW